MNRIFGGLPHFMEHLTRTEAYFFACCVIHSNCLPFLVGLRERFFPLRFSIFTGLGPFTVGTKKMYYIHLYKNIYLKLWSIVQLLKIVLGLTNKKLIYSLSEHIAVYLCRANMYQMQSGGS